LIVTTLALTGSGERNWYERGSFLLDVDWPVEPRHPRGRTIRDTPPTFVFERVYDALATVDRCPADAAHASHVRGQSRTPAALMDADGMSAALAPR